MNPPAWTERSRGHATGLPTRVRRAFTLVEVMVVIAILAALVALLLPAVQSAGESARLTQCKNHVKQLAVASQQHEATMRFWAAYAGEATPGRLEFPAGRSRNTQLLGPN